MNGSTFFKHSEVPEHFKSEHIEAARDKLRVMKMPPDEKKAYERFWIGRSIYRSELESAKEDGREEGREEGRAEGLEEGRAELQHEMARQMLAHGEPLDKISLYSGLSADEIERITQI